MASEKSLRKQMRAKKKVAKELGLLDKEKKINRAISASNKNIVNSTKKTFEKNKISINWNKKHSKKQSIPEVKSQTTMPAEFDEFGVLVCEQTPLGISIRFPDFNQDIDIEKSEKPYSQIIEGALFDLAVNTIRAQELLNKRHGLSFKLPAALPIENYSDRPFVGFDKIDHNVEQGNIPIYSSVFLDLKAVYQEAYKTKSFKQYKKEVLPDDNKKSSITKQMLNQSSTIGKTVIKAEEALKKDKSLYLNPTAA